MSTMTTRSCWLPGFALMVGLTVAGCGSSGGSGGKAGSDGGAGHGGAGATGTAGISGDAGATGTAGSSAAGTTGTAGSSGGSSGGGTTGAAGNDGGAGASTAGQDSGTDAAAGSDAAADTGATDASSVDVAVDTGSDASTLCTGVVNLAVTIAESNSTAAYADTAAGGTIFPGTYFAASRTYFNSGNPGTWKQTLYLHADGKFQDIHDHNGTLSTSGGTYSALATTFSAVATCPAAGTVTLHYTATSTTLTLFEDTQQRITVYSKL